MPRDSLTVGDVPSWQDPSHRIYCEGNLAFVPVRNGISCDQELAKRHPYHGRGYQRLGDIIVVHGPRPTGNELQDIIAWVQPRGILWLRSIDGVTRQPSTELMYGAVGDICQRENGCRYWLNPAHIMFAQGNREERARMARAVVERGRVERVADMCAGIGYFTIPMARAGAWVHAMEVEPRTYGYLLRTIEENGLQSRVEACCGDSCTLLAGTYDRFVIGHYDALHFLPAALEHAKEGSILHVHTRGGGEAALHEAVASAGFCATLTMHRVKKYAPYCWHMVWDVVLA